MATANTTIQVTFGSSSSSAAGTNSVLTAEIDSRTDGLNGGKTSFLPGDSVYFLAYMSSDVQVSSVVTSAGTVAQAGSVMVQKSEDVQFQNTDTASLSFPANSIVSMTWMGRDLGELTLVGANSLKAAQSGVGVCRVVTNAPASAYVLTSPPTLNGLTDYSILVLLTGTITP